MEPLFFIIIALVIGTATRHFLKKTPLPYTVLLMIFGIGLGLLVRFDVFENLHGHFWHTLNNALHWAGTIDPHVILFIFLPILIFEAAFAMDVHTFKKTVGNAAILAIPGILLALFLTGGMVKGLSAIDIGFKDWGWKLAFLFGVVVSATDPVAVVALLKELGASKKLGTLIEGESLLNDGTAIVLFFVFMAILPFELHVHGGGNSVLYEFFRVALGGIIMGLLIGGITLIWVRRVFNDAMIEITLIVVAAYLTFYVAEHFFHVSGVLGLVALGLAMASAGRTRISAEVQHFLHEFWELAAFIANTLIFVIVGVVIAERTRFSFNDFLALIILYVGIHIIRAIVIAVFYPLMQKVGYGLPKKDAIVAWYGGLRGAVGLALALIFVGEIAKVENLSPELQLVADQFLFYLAGIVALTLLINATTIKFVVRALGLTDIPPVKVMMFSNVFRSVDKSLDNEIELLRKDRFMNGADWNQVREYLPKHNIPTLSADDIAKMDPFSEARRRILEKEKSSYWNQFKEGLLAPLAYTKLTDNIKEVIDKEGTIPLNERDYLANLWRAPKLLSKLQSAPIIGAIARKSLLDRLAVNYDTARGFVISQEEIAKLASIMDFDFNQDDVTDDEEERIATTIKDEINSNRIKGLTYLKETHQAYPEITKAIETRQAARSVLNYEKSSIKKLQKEGKLEDSEAAGLIVDMELRMKKLMEAPLIIKMPEPIEILEQLPWLKQVDDSIIQKVKAIAIEKNHPLGYSLISQGDSGESGMVIIARGAVKVVVGETTVDLQGSGGVIGEMSVLAGVPRTATVIADTPVTALWLSTKEMQVILKESNELEMSLWHTAGLRFAENLLGNIEPYRTWPQIKLRRWLSNGEIVKTKDGQIIKLQDQVAVLISGAASDKVNNHIYQAPEIINSPEVLFGKNAVVFISAK
ncbi:MAG: cyclic nucleotide-binding domain-containing protein [Bacteroidetes bacterium]|nr:cyclic nucleotide-binding domain-containing protein [Bacteroidota bacterium]MBT4969674.1 cyclic nucleotide-binding domain-containing protein [Bacteroidota bacterium]